MKTQLFTILFTILTFNLTAQNPPIEQEAIETIAAGETGDSGKWYSVDGKAYKYWMDLGTFGEHAVKGLFKEAKETGSMMGADYSKPFDDKSTLHSSIKSEEDYHTIAYTSKAGVTTIDRMWMAKYDGKSWFLQMVIKKSASGKHLHCYLTLKSM